MPKKQGGEVGFHWLDPLLPGWQTGTRPGGGWSRQPLAPGGYLACSNSHFCDLGGCVGGRGCTSLCRYPRCLRYVERRMMVLDGYYCRWCSAWRWGLGESHRQLEARCGSQRASLVALQWKNGESLGPSSWLKSHWTSNTVTVKCWVCRPTCVTSLTLEWKIRINIFVPTPILGP